MKKKKIKKMPSWEWSEYKIKITNFDYSIEPQEADFLYLYGELLEPKNTDISKINILIYPESDREKINNVQGSVQQGKLADKKYELGGILWIWEESFRSLIQVLTSNRPVYFGISVEKIKKQSEMIQSYYFSTQDNFGEG